MKTTRNTHGVSVVGIMVAIAVLGIVVAMAVPAQMRNASVRHERLCMENLAHIEGAIVALRLEEGNTAIESERLPLNDLIRTTNTMFLQKQPTCLAGGAYTALGTGTAICTEHGSLNQ